MDPVSAEGLSRKGFGLGQLVLMVRKDEIHPPCMHIDRGAEQFVGHSRALDVPPRSTASEVRVPHNIPVLRIESFP